MRQRHKIPVTCPSCGQVRYLEPHHANPLTPCKKCHTSRIGKLGYKATVAKHGDQFAIGFVRQYRLDHPSVLERAVMTALDQLGLRYEREYIYQVSPRKVYLIDFVVSAGIDYFIEVNGVVHRYHLDRDTAKAAAIRAAGYPLIILTQDDINRPDLSDRINARLCNI